MLAKGLGAAMLGMLFACATNPSFATSAGMGCLTFAVVFADMLHEQVSLQRPKENGIAQDQRLQVNATASLGVGSSRSRRGRIVRNRESFGTDMHASRR